MWNIRAARDLQRQGKHSKAIEVYRKIGDFESYRQLAQYHDPYLNRLNGEDLSQLDAIDQMKNGVGYNKSFTELLLLEDSFEAVVNKAIDYYTLQCTRQYYTVYRLCRLIGQDAAGSGHLSQALKQSDPNAWYDFFEPKVDNVNVDNGVTANQMRVWIQEFLRTSFEGYDHLDEIDKLIVHLSNTINGRLSLVPPVLQRILKCCDLGKIVTKIERVANQSAINRIFCEALRQRLVGKHDLARQILCRYSLDDHLRHLNYLDCAKDSLEGRCQLVDRYSALQYYLLAFDVVPLHSYYGQACVFYHIVKLEASKREQLLRCIDACDYPLEMCSQFDPHHRLFQYSDAATVLYREFTDVMALRYVPQVKKDELVAMAKVIRTSWAMPKVLMNMVGSYFPWWKGAGGLRPP